MKSNYLTAKEAREIASSTNIEQLFPILQDIKENAKYGKHKLNIYHSLSAAAIEKLQELGYEIYDHPSIDIQMESLYHTISW